MNIVGYMPVYQHFYLSGKIFVRIVKQHLEMNLRKRLKFIAQIALVLFYAAQPSAERFKLSRSSCETLLEGGEQRIMLGLRPGDNAVHEST